MKNKIIFAIICLTTFACSNVNYVDKRLNNRPAEIFEGVTPHKLVAAAAPLYPAELRKSGTEGFVYLKLDVAKNGNAENISVVASRPKGIFEKYAIEAARKWKYNPANLNGKTLTTKNVVTMLKFCITDKNQPSEHPDPMCVDPAAEGKRITSVLSIPRVTYEP